MPSSNPDRNVVTPSRALFPKSAAETQIVAIPASVHAATFSGEIATSASIDEPTLDAHPQVRELSPRAKGIDTPRPVAPGLFRTPKKYQ